MKYENTNLPDNRQHHGMSTWPWDSHVEASHDPGKKTVYPPTMDMTAVQMRP